MDNYKLQSELRKLDEISDGSGSFILTKELQEIFQDKLYEMDRMRLTLEAYKTVLKDALR